MTELSVVEARTLLARAFVDDPLMVWFFPDEDARPHACAALFGLFAENYLAGGRVDVVRRPEPVAVAMWRWPREAERAPGPERLPSIGGLMTALMGSARAAAIGGDMAVLAELRPAEPHAYLHLLAVHPDARRQGLGGEVLDRGLAAARAAGLVACLDTMNPANVPFYEGHGMSVRHEVPLGAGGPTVWSMATG
ncbi:N-acetyltransferase [Blastococcus sp. CT_GayMR20]|uniref:GNAT family N-acetyltransferase n=1 Tax=Blastococcus sp. CT_GayMR20 TaxID=2559609 RepID=UPI001072EF9E|nr:GNAT family N-acetyltransferase [Blastococcus sp. CT_GayMR20]TFV76983.1 N-acetyltransferase [Blastococcus sp. CT_GayMR20]